MKKVIPAIFMLAIALQIIHIASLIYNGYSEEGMNKTLLIYILVTILSAYIVTKGWRILSRTNQKELILWLSIFLIITILLNSWLISGKALFSPLIVLVMAGGVYELSQKKNK